MKARAWIKWSLPAPGTIPRGRALTHKGRRMNTTLRKFGCIVGVAAFLLTDAGVAAKPPAGPDVGHSSCGGTALPNTYCSFDTTGDGVVIGHDSCNVEGACTTLGNGARIGNGSCNGEQACTNFGELGGSSDVGNNSCNGPFACQFAGSEGDSVIGDNSCNVGDSVCLGAGASESTDIPASSRIGNNSCNNGDVACLLVGVEGISVIGNNTCNGLEACTFAGQQGFVCDENFNCTPFDGISVIGNDSCNGLDSCFDVGQGGTNRIGNSSCTGLASCKNAGSFTRDSRIGNHSCNYDATRVGDEFFGACVGNDGTIGNNKFN